MKLLTILTTFIITLASSNAFARTFVCENWEEDTEKVEIQGTMFVGEKDGDTFIIKDYGKIKKTLTLIGDDGSYKFFHSKNNNVTSIFSIKENVLKYYQKDGFIKEEKYDLKITELWGKGAFCYTYCNYQ